MREILFRAKLKSDNGIHKKGEWVYGHYCELIDGKKAIPYIYGNGEVNKNTVGQYTGLTDKNGKKIFEGDIVSITALGNDHCQKGARTTACIENYMGNSCICVYGGSLGVTLHSILIDHTVEVIGNIHDNPELLKGGAE